MLSLLLILTVSLVFSGIIIRTKSIASGRKGPGIFQPLKDIVRLCKKGTVFSTKTSFTFQVAPAFYFASVLAAILVVPFGQHKGIISFEGDFLFFAYVLATGKFFLIIASLDTGSSFEGMGASREALYSMLAEPALFIIICGFTLMTGHTSFAGLFASLHFGSYISYATGFLAAYVLAILAMVENSRMPVDDPKTHLELTMVHEVMVLDNSGLDLGMILYASNLKFAMYGALIANFFFGSFPLYINVVIFLSVQAGLAVLTGLIESFMARFRMNHNPQYIFTLSAVALLIFIGILLMANDTHPS